MAKKSSFLSGFDLSGLWRPQPETAASSRTRPFRQHGNGRFWWHTLRNTDYVPPVYARLSDPEWALMAEWFSVTQANNTIGEINVPAMDFIQGLIMGNGIQRIVQLGHYCGYSALLIGFMLRAMRATPGLISFDISQSGQSITLQVTDKGVGIPSEDLKYLFEPFHRGSNVSNITGTGLGLSIVKQAVEVHNGTITVESVLGEGSCFIVTLPKLNYE